MVLENVWVGDAEVFAYDNFWVFRSVDTGERVRIHNDNLAVIRFLEEREPLFAGFNIRDYDQHILRANQLDYDPEQVKEVNDVIIQSRYDEALNIYSYFRGEPWVDTPPLIDLFPDIVNKPSLKMLEGFMGLSIEESSVPFDIDRPLTEDEIELVFEYCTYDVDASYDLLMLRMPYINAKIRVCELAGIDPLKELKHPMPRLTADVLGAVRQTYENEPYVFPPYLNHDNVPDAAYQYAAHLDRDSGVAKVEKGRTRNVLFNFYGCPTIVGVGGIHSCIGNMVYKRTKGEYSETVAETIPYQEHSTEDRVVVIQDASAYYPTTINNCDYMSRSVPEENRGLYPDFCTLKDTAKAEGNKDDETAAKLLINAASGCFRSPTNALSDPIQGISLCITGQLYILDVVTRLHKECSSIKLIQLNTDGWVYSIDRIELPTAQQIVDDWAEETHQRVGTDMVKSIWQRDVNNYVMVFDDNNEIKVKGGTVGGYFGRGKGWAQRGFAYSNTIIDKAIVDYLVYGIPVRDTIENETDLSRFQIICKAGSSYPKVFKDCKEVFEVIPEGSRRKIPRVIEVTRGAEVQRVNRIYATNIKKECFSLMKETRAGKLNRFPDTPEHAFVDNSGEEMTLDMLDRQWYTDLAMKRLHAFIGETTMTEETKVVTKKATTKKEAPKQELEFEEKVLLLQKLVREAYVTVQPDGFIGHLNYEYVKTGNYKDLLASCCQEAGLIYSTVFTDLQFLGAIQSTKNGAPEFGATVTCELNICDTIDGHTITSELTSRGFGFGVGASGNCVSSAQTNAMRNVITNAFLINTGYDDDVNDANKSDTKAPKGYVDDAKKAALKTSITAQTKDSVTYMQAPAAIDLGERINELLLDEKNELSDKATASFSKVLADYYTESNGEYVPKEDDGHIKLPKEVYTKIATKLDELGA